MEEVNMIVVQSLISLIMTALIAWVGVNMRTLKKNYSHMKNACSGIRELLKKEIDDECNVAKDKGFCSDSQKESIQELYHMYNELDGNGRITTKVNETFELPRVRGDA